MVLPAFASTNAFGKATTAKQAATAVGNWLARDGRPLGTGLGTRVANVDTLTTADGTAHYFVVNLVPSGFVIVPGDDLVEPIIAFAGEGVFEPSAQNPLGALVINDVPARLQAVNAKPAAQPGAAAESLKAAAKWADLLSPAQTLNGIPSVSDLRVAPLVASRWNQTTACGSACYNYYAPPGAGGSAGNYPIGCVATALAQLLRFHQHPTEAVGTKSFSTQLCGALGSRSLRGGDGLGGPYAWNDMPLVPAANCGALTLAQRQAIGALTHDAAVSVSMNFCSESSSADTLQAVDALRYTFAYSQAIRGYNSGSTIGVGLIAMINPNLDAGWPVLLGIVGPPGGHAVVADGYGYSGGAIYHHLNLGWAGTSDAWYNLPAINTVAGTFNSVYKCVYNVCITGTGEIISGRVTNARGRPVAGATITATRSRYSPIVTTSNAEGIYALTHVPASGQYTVLAAVHGRSIGSRTAAVGSSIDYEPAGGNAWAIDFQDPAAAPSDFDADGDVDGADYGLFAGCFNGTGNPIPSGCAAVDLNGDQSVDGIDYAYFAGCFNSTGNPPACY